MTVAICQAQESVSVDMSGQVSFWKSLVSGENLYFSFGGDPTKAGDPDNDNECYAFIAVSQDEEYVYLRHITFVKAGTPIWIWGNKQVHSIYTFSTLEELNDFGEEISGYGSLEEVFDNTAGNLLVGSASAATSIQLGDYVLSKKDDFVHAVTQTMVDAGNTLGYGKCLLRLGAAGSRATLRIGMLDDDDEPTAVDAVCTRDGQLIMYDPTKPSFDAQGRPVAPGQKGLHIQNGYKFYIK